MNDLIKYRNIVRMSQRGFISNKHDNPLRGHHIIFLGNRNCVKWKKSYKKCHDVLQSEVYPSQLIKNFCLLIEFVYSVPISVVQLMAFRRHGLGVVICYSTWKKGMTNQDKLIYVLGKWRRVAENRGPLLCCAFFSLAI